MILNKAMQVLRRAGDARKSFSRCDLCVTRGIDGPEAVGCPRDAATCSHLDTALGASPGLAQVRSLEWNFYLTGWV